MHTHIHHLTLVHSFTRTYTLALDVCRFNAQPTATELALCDGDAAAVAARQPFLFLLSAKAGGCGLNLVGGNRLVLYDQVLLLL
jgi:hypothetical protein